MKPVVAFDNYPSFGNAGARQAPGDAKYSLGFVPTDTLPAEWANYFFHGATKGVSDLNTAVRSIWLELQNVLTSYEITPDADSTDQILTALSKIYPKIATCNTAAATADKVLAISGNVLKTGDLYVVTMDNGNTASNPTLTINNVAATTAPICDANGTAVGSGAWAAGDTIKLLYTGSKYLMSTRAVVDTMEDGNMSPITSNAVFNAFSNQFDLVWPIGSTYIQFPKQKSPNDPDMWGNFSTWELIDYGGAFFRANGGDADSFERTATISSVNGTTITFAAAQTIKVGTLLYDPVLNETRTVTTVTSTTVVVVNALFTNPNLESVIVSQDSQNKYHAHNWSNTHSHPNTVGVGTLSVSGSVVYQSGSSGSKNGINYDQYDSGSTSYSKSNWYGSISGKPSISNANQTISGTTGYNGDSTKQEARPVNFTIKVWVRTA